MDGMQLLRTRAAANLAAGSQPTASLAVVARLACAAGPQTPKDRSRETTGTAERASLRPKSAEPLLLVHESE